jgi:pimeloyl-ACP methyl ester carboxylesterase
VPPVNTPMTVLRVPAGEAELCVETFGRQQDPAVLLISGATESMEAWPCGLCEQLAAASRFVVRYDHRDTGRSTRCPPGRPDYTGDDLAEDVVHVLDALGIEAAHLVGVSMGGGIAQQLAVAHRSRVRSLTLVATTCAFDRAGTTPLPPPVPQDTDTDTDDHNHWVAIGTGAGADHEMAEIGVPTLVLHGTEDPVFPPAHGEVLVEEIADASLVRLEGMGHEVPPRSLWDTVVPAITGHTS